MRPHAVNGKAVLFIEAHGRCIGDAYFQCHHVGAPANGFVEQLQEERLTESPAAIGGIDPDGRDVRFIEELPHASESGDWRSRGGFVRFIPKRQQTERAQATPVVDIVLDEAAARLQGPRIGAT